MIVERTNPIWPTLERLFGLTERPWSFPNGSSYSTYEMTLNQWQPVEVAGWRAARNANYVGGYSFAMDPQGNAYHVALQVERGPGADFGAHFYTRSHDPQTARFVLSAAGDWRPYGFRN